MNEQNVFNTPEGEVKRLVEELREAKEALREVSRKLSQIELRLQRSFPALLPEQSAKRRGPTLESPALTVEQVMRAYEDLVNLARRDEHQLVRERMAMLGLSDLNLLRRELGASLGKRKASRRTLEDAIIGRIRESVMLSKHATRGDTTEQTGSPSKSSPEEPDGGESG